MRKFRLYFLAVLTATGLLVGCSASAPATDKSNEAETAAETALEETGTEEEAGPDAGAEEEASSEAGADEETGKAETAESGEPEEASAEGAEGGSVVISPEITEGHVIAPEASEEELAEVVNVNFELVTRDDKEHAVITGINGKDEVVWQNVTEEFESGDVPSLTGLMILADSYFYVENGDVVRLNKETGVEYWRNVELRDRVADKAWAHEGETFYFAGADAADLFVMSMHGQTIKRIRNLTGFFEEPVRLVLKDGRILITYQKTPTGKPALVSVDPEDYSSIIMVDTDVVPQITDDTIYVSNTRSTLALRTGPGKDYEYFDAVEGGTEMYVLGVVGDYAYVSVKETGQVAYCTGKYVLIDDGSYRSAVEVAQDQGTALPEAEQPAQEPENTEEPEETEEESSASEDVGKTFYVDVSSTLTLRKEADYGSDYVASLEPLTELTLLGYEDGLAHVRVNATGEEGYVSPRYITDDPNDLTYAGR